MYWSISVILCNSYIVRVICKNVDKTRIKTFIKAKLKNSDDQMNIDKYRVAAELIEYHIKMHIIFL